MFQHVLCRRSTQENRIYIYIYIYIYNTLFIRTEGYLVDHVNADNIDCLIGDANAVGPPVHNRNVKHRCKHAQDNGDLKRSRDGALIGWCV